MSAHTPGPWRLVREGDAFDGYWNILAAHQTARSKFGPQVATVLGRLGHDSESEANARLIAAAPRMLEALRAALARFESEPVGVAAHIGAIRAILRDVEGESNG